MPLFSRPAVPTALRALDLPRDAQAIADIALSRPEVDVYTRTGTHGDAWVQEAKGQFTVVRTTERQQQILSAARSIDASAAILRAANQTVPEWRSALEQALESETRASRGRGPLPAAVRDIATLTRVARQIAIDAATVSDHMANVTDERRVTIDVIERNGASGIDH